MLSLLTICTFFCPIRFENFALKIIFMEHNKPILGTTMLWNKLETPALPVLQQQYHVGNTTFSSLLFRDIQSFSVWS